MPQSASPHHLGPVLVYAPAGRDGAIIAEILEGIGVSAVVATERASFLAKLAEAGAAMVASEVLDRATIVAVASWVQGQPGWSDFPFVVLIERPVDGRPGDDDLGGLEAFGNVTFVERPCYAQTLISAARSALRARQRQLQLVLELEGRAHVQAELDQEQHRSQDELEGLVRRRTAESEEAHEALRQSQKMEAVGQLTGGIAHDFNNLLAGISGSLELMEKRLAQDRSANIEKYMKIAQESTRRAASLTHRLLAFSRRQTLDPKVVDTNRLICGMEDLLQRSVGPDVQVEVVQAGGLWRVRLDGSQLENAVLNLCINARDAMAPYGGRLTIETANKWLGDRSAHESDLPPGEYVTLSVSDTGAGMPADVIEKVFDPFFTTKPLGQGTGLGLSMVYGFVRQSGGQVRISSEVDRGTTVCLYLPRFEGEDDIVVASEPVEMDQGLGETVLIIDDEPTIRMLLSDVLEEQGYRVLEAFDGPSGLKLLTSEARIDLLVTDVGLPGGLNGRQVADAARITRPSLKVLFITGFAENAVIGSGHLEAGMSVLTKPFEMVAVANKVRELIDL